MLGFHKLLRKNNTEAEQILWERLRRGGLNEKFRRQVTFGVYIADFCCFPKKLIIELDGSSHRNRKFYDAKRTEYLGKLGYRVIRFWNGDVTNNIEVVLDEIRKNLALSEY